MKDEDVRPLSVEEEAHWRSKYLAPERGDETLLGRGLAQRLFATLDRERAAIEMFRSLARTKTEQEKEFYARARMEPLLGDEQITYKGVAYFRADLMPCHICGCVGVHGYNGPNVPKTAYDDVSRQLKATQEKLAVAEERARGIGK